MTPTPNNVAGENRARTSRLPSRRQIDIFARRLTLCIAVTDRYVEKYANRRVAGSPVESYSPDNVHASQACCLFNLKSVKSTLLARSHSGLKRFSGAVRASCGFQHRIFPRDYESSR